MPFYTAADNQFVKKGLRRGSLQVVGGGCRAARAPLRGSALLAAVRLRRPTLERRCLGLREGVVERLLPAVVVDGPDDFRFVACGEGGGPDFAVAFVCSDVEAVYDGHAAGKFALCFHFKEMVGLGCNDRGIEGHGHGYRVGQADAVLAGLHEVGLLATTVALDRELGNGIVEGKDVPNVRSVQHGVVAGQLPADELDGQATSGHDPGCFGIAPDVVLGGGDDVAFATGRATHDHAAADPCGDGRRSLQGESDVRQRPEGDQDEAGMRFDGTNDGIDCRFFFRGAPRRRIAAVAEAVVAMEPFGAAVRALERLFRAGKNRDARLTEFRSAKSISSGLRESHIAGNRGDRQNFDLPITQDHDESDGIVGSRIGVNQERPFHEPQDSKSGGGRLRMENRASKVGPLVTGAMGFFRLAVEPMEGRQTRGTDNSRVGQGRTGLETEEGAGFAESAAMIGEDVAGQGSASLRLRAIQGKSRKVREPAGTSKGLADGWIVGVDQTATPSAGGKRKP
jgi:hypothetical protein